MTLGPLLRAVLRGAALLLVLSPFGAGATELGVYRWHALIGPANVDKFEAWLGRPVQLAEDFEALDNWDAIDGAAWQLGPWSQWVRAKPGRNLVLGVPLLPSSGDVSLDRCAAGLYDQYWRNLANELAYYGLHWAYLRLGWEMDGNWFPWGAPQGSGRETSFAGCFRRVVQTMRAAQPANQWKFVWNPTNAWTDPAWLTATWPGDAYVDVVGLDLYDQSWALNTYPYPSTCDSACRLARQQTAWTGMSWYLQTTLAFARARGKPFAIPEWGLYRRADGHGGLDNPYYIQKMYDFIADPNNGVLFHVYFDVNSPDGDHHISGADSPTLFPQSAALYRQLFGAVAAPAPTPTPAPDTTAPTTFLNLPAAGSILYRRTTITLEASASDNVGVTGVEFWINGRMVCRDANAPHRCSVSTGSSRQSQYVIEVRAFDAAGNVGRHSRTYTGR